MARPYRPDTRLSCQRSAHSLPPQAREVLLGRSSASGLRAAACPTGSPGRASNCQAPTSARLRTRPRSLLARRTDARNIRAAQARARSTDRRVRGRALWRDRERLAGPRQRRSRRCCILDADRTQPRPPAACARPRSEWRRARTPRIQVSNRSARDSRAREGVESPRPR